LKSAFAQSGLSPQLASDFDWIYADLLPPHAFIACAVSRSMVDPAQGSNKLVTYLSAERTRLHEPEVVRIGRLSPAYKAGLLGDQPKMLLVAVAPRLGNREGALVNPFGIELTGWSRAPIVFALYGKGCNLANVRLKR